LTAPRSDRIGEARQPTSGVVGWGEPLKGAKWWANRAEEDGTWGISGQGATGLQFCHQHRYVSVAVAVACTTQPVYPTIRVSLEE